MVVATAEVCKVSVGHQIPDLSYSNSVLFCHSMGAHQMEVFSLCGLGSILHLSTGSLAPSDNMASHLYQTPWILYPVLVHLL